MEDLVKIQNVSMTIILERTGDFQSTCEEGGCVIAITIIFYLRWSTHYLRFQEDYHAICPIT